MGEAISTALRSSGPASLRHMTAQAPAAFAERRYMPQLDSLRAFAVFAVFITHSEVKNLGPIQLGALGGLGVQLFFVLSGFLITRILLECRNDESPAHAIGRFYLRRALRIFPIYYLTIAIFVILHNPHILQALPWHFTYTSNIFFARRGGLDLLGSHFWTLSVEEQFYLVWPWLIVLLPSRWLSRLLLGTVLIAAGYRLISRGEGWSGPLAWGLLPPILDQFGIGAALAIYWDAAQRRSWMEAFMRKGALVLIPLAILSAYFTPLLPPVIAVFDPLLRGVVFVLIIHGAALGYAGTFGKLLEWPPLLHLGKISYGLYVYHPFCSWFVTGVLRHISHPAARYPFQHFFLFVTLTIIVANVSWFYFEKPIASLKRKFDVSTVHQDFAAPLIVVEADRRF
jgi:peptidoglycan/LPS O-acetylase OafA/YrhL